MKVRILGRTKWEVSEVGFGGWGIGGRWWGRSEDSESLNALSAALDAGINFFDTAYVYGDGHSEELMGKALKNKKVTVATKIPPKNMQWPPTPGTISKEAFPADWIYSCTERSLQKLKRDVIDLTQFHVWRDEWLEEDEWKTAVTRLKKDGKIKAFGVSLVDHEPESALRLVASGMVDTVQVIFNIFDQSPTEKLFPHCLKNHVGVIARVPFDEGSLTGTFTLKTKFQAGDFRGRYFGGTRLKEAVKRVDRLKKLLGPEAKTMPELALKFVLSHPEVSVVIPGMRTADHVKANTRMGDPRSLSPETLKRLESHHWQRNFYRFWHD